MPGALFWIQGRKFQKQGQNLCHQGRNIEVRGTILSLPGAGFFLAMLAPALGGGTCQAMHSGPRGPDCERGRGGSGAVIKLLLK